MVNEVRQTVFSTRSAGPRGRSRALRAAVLWAVGLAAAGCGAAPPPEAPRTAAPVLQFVEADAPFVVDWEPAQIASLTAGFRSPNIGAMVVAYQRNTMRLLPDCWLSGVYVPSGIGMYRGALQVRRSDASASTPGVRPEALQQISTSSNLAQTALLDYRFVVVGRHALGASRTSAKVLELSERKSNACRGATHFVRAGLTGAFEFMGDANRAPGMPAETGAPGEAPVRLALAGDFTGCMTAGSAADPACSAFLKIELAPLRPARVDLRLVSLTLKGDAVPAFQLRFRGKNNYRSETTPLAAPTAVAGWVLPVVEIAEDAPLHVELVKPASGGPQIIASGEITPADLRKAVFDIELQNPPGGAKVGALQLAASENAAAP